MENLTYGLYSDLFNNHVLVTARHICEHVVISADLPFEIRHAITMKNRTAPVGT